MTDPKGIFPRTISILRLPDGRWAVQNERNVSDLTRHDLREMADAFFLWCHTHDAKLEAREK